MSAFAGLKLVAAKRPQAAPPIVQRRNKLSSQLFQQIELARCLSEGKTYSPMRLRNIKDKLTGERRTVEAVKRVRQWWFVSDTGKVCLQVRYGTRVLELAKGKNSIEVGTAAELLTVLSTVKSAVEAGDLDAQIDAACAAVRERFAQ
jgi:hypothetical protein